MSNVLTFAPRQKEAAPELPQIMSLAERRAHLENALETSLDTADHIMAALDQWDDEQEEEGGTKPLAVNPSLKAMAAYAGQVVTLREPVAPPEPPTLAEPDVAPETEEADADAVLFVPEPLTWYGAGNVVSFAGIALLSLIVRG